ncbi:hypothetical protein BX600DRAFT_100440 [Xylariales sp. PMI_506]|nr:hypothetical protein BX600DRAFT_100440 [Xylariales sp. PMI_506]
MYKSFFSYTIERNYPYRWFTPVVIFGGLVFTALISFVNVVTSGYELAATSSSNPNATIANPRWYGSINWPSYFTGNAQATCAASTFTLNSEIFTNNSAFPYTLQRVWRFKDDGTMANLGSLVYENNPIQNCNVNYVTIQVMGRYSQNRGLSAISQAGVLLNAYATCSIDIDTSQTDSVGGPTYFDLTASYDLVNPNVPRFLERNEITQASLFWGESLLQLYWMVFARNYKVAANPTVSNFQYDAIITLTRNSSATIGTAAEVESLDFFKVTCFTENSFCGANNIPLLMQGGNDRPYPSIWQSVDILGKAMWFSVLTDLGRNETEVPNMLIDPALLANLTSNYTAEYQAWPNDTGNITQALDESLSQASFNPDALPLPDLNATQSTLATNYVCQVPRMKSIGTLVFSVIQADLVFLQTAFMLFQLVVNYFLQSRHPESNYCEGCQRGAALDTQQSGAKVEAQVEEQDSASSMHSKATHKGYSHINQEEIQSP